MVKHRTDWMEIRREIITMDFVELTFAELQAYENGDDCAWDQPCKYGHRVNDCAVYCHHPTWKAAPIKCYRTWWSDGEIMDEDCPGYVPNPNYYKS